MKIFIIKLVSIAYISFFLMLLVCGVMGKERVGDSGLEEFMVCFAIISFMSVIHYFINYEHNT
tara:strand:+ start:264 stop:452 length:189 start_codon:yes stop_codon:yes gene_type:complete